MTMRWFSGVPGPDVQSLRLRMCFSAHAVDGMHYGVDLCKKRLAEFYWDSMEEEVRDFCLQCSLFHSQTFVSSGALYNV